MKEAIQKAIEGGYRSYDPMVSDGSGRYINMIGDAIFLDKEFWQALGKVMGWQGDYQMEDGLWMHIPFKGASEDHHIPVWQSSWIMFIHHLASGGDANEFFDSLLKS